MQIVKTSRLKPGMVTAAPVTIRHGLPVVKEGITLTNSLISRIAFYEIKEVKIEDQINSAETFGSDPSTPTYSLRIESSSLFQSFKTDYAKSVIDLKMPCPRFLPAKIRLTPEHFTRFCSLYYQTLQLPCRCSASYMPCRKRATAYMLIR